MKRSSWSETSFKEPLQSLRVLNSFSKSLFVMYKGNDSSDAAQSGLCALLVPLEGWDISDVLGDSPELQSRSYLLSSKIFSFSSATSSSS